MKKNERLLLGIETTCDETGAALVRGGREILSNVVASSADLHEKYGGVFPELACRRHVEALVPVLKEALSKARVTAKEIDAIAVAKGPGLIGALLLGMQMAKGLSLAWEKPLLGVHHVEAHLYAAMMNAEEPLRFPALGIALSGGHTSLIHLRGVGEYEPIASTVDDAIGEAFDKVASLLGLPYPGGPPVEALARRGEAKRYRFRAGKVKGAPLHFSFSGLKTAVLYATKDKSLSEQDKADIAASFQEAAFSDVVEKASLALKAFPAKAIYLGGGVCNNERLKVCLSQAFPHIPLFWPSLELTLDNAAMIAGLGFHHFLKRPQGDGLTCEVRPRFPLVEVQGDSSP